MTEVHPTFGMTIPDGAPAHTFPVSYDFGELAVNDAAPGAGRAPDRRGADPMVDVDPGRPAAPGDRPGTGHRYAPLRGIAADLGLTPGQLALAWLLHQDGHVVPIPGSRTPAHIDENLDSARITLHPDTREVIHEALADVTPAGGTRLI